MHALMYAGGESERALLQSSQNFFCRGTHMNDYIIYLIIDINVVLIYS